MKTILVLTNLSKSAKNAANVALTIAAKTNANVLLLNSYLAPFAILSSEAEGRTMENYELIEKISEKELIKETKRLRKRLASMANLSHQPTINFVNSTDSLTHAIKHILHSYQVSLIVMGARSTALASLFSAVDLNGLLHNIHCPLLLVPSKYQAATVKNLVYATDLAAVDKTYIQQIANYAEMYQFHVHVCHVSAPAFIPDFKEEDEVTSFLSAIQRQEFGHLSFAHVQGKDVAKTLDQLCKKVGADALCVTYRPHGFSWQLLHQSTANKLTKNQQLPLVIMPAKLN